MAFLWYNLSNNQRPDIAEDNQRSSSTLDRIPYIYVRRTIKVRLSLAPSNCVRSTKKLDLRARSCAADTWRKMNSAIAIPGNPYNPTSTYGWLYHDMVLLVKNIKPTISQATKNAPSIWKTPVKQLKTTCLHTVPIWPDNESAGKKEIVIIKKKIQSIIEKITNHLWSSPTILIGKTPLRSILYLKGASLNWRKLSWTIPGNRKRWWCQLNRD